MKNRLLLLAILMGSLFSMTGCIDIIEEIFLNKDGSGRYTMKLDMSEMLSEEYASMMEGMFEGMGEESAEEEGYDEEDMMLEENPFEDPETAEEAAAFGEDVEEEESSYANRDKKEMDSVFSFKDVPDSVRQLLGDKAYLLDKAFGEMHMSESKGEFWMNFTIDFDNLGEATDFLANFDKMMDSGGDDMGMMSSAFNMSDDNPTYSFSKNVFKRKGGDSKPSDEGGEEMEMMKMMFAGAEYVTIYHLPGKAKKVSNKDAEVLDDGQTVKLSVPMIDFMEGKASLENTIKIK